MRLGDRDIADFSYPYVIAEIGANHNGDMNLAAQMIDAAKACGCDAVKFQSWTPESLIAREEYERNVKYDDSPKKHFGSLREMVEKYSLRPEQHRELKEYSDAVGVEFCSTPFSRAEADMLDELDVKFFKIASMDVNNLDLLSHVAGKHKPIILSTGMATLAEVETAIETIETRDNTQIVLLHCVAIYPPAYEDINLNNILSLRQIFGYPVGFSDHTLGTVMSLASIALGSCLIEKHFTLDKNLPGWDHEISADPDEMKRIVNESRNINKALGLHRRIVSQAEQEKKLKFRRSIVASRDLGKGAVIKAEDLDYKRPGTGIRPDEACYLINRVLKRDLRKDDLIGWDDL